MRLSQQVEAGTEFTLMVGKQIHVICISHPTPNKQSFLVGPCVVLSLWFSDSSFSPTLVQDNGSAVAELCKGKLVPCSCKHQSDLVFFSSSKRLTQS